MPKRTASIPGFHPGQSVLNPMRALLLSAVANLLMPQQGFADDRPDAHEEHFEIRAQSFAGALQAYAQQTGEQVVFFSDVGEGWIVARISGTYTRE